MDFVLLFGFNFFLKSNYFLFLMVLMVVSMSSLMYSFYYLNHDKMMKFYLLMLLGFVISMILLIMAGSFFTFFLGWDGLGVTSYFLVCYYFNDRSSKSSMTTFMSNRVGDMMFFIFLTLLLYDYMNMMMMSSLIFMIIMMMSFTKSAQLPFTAWLPLAMAAPTPISALVHSSTLVTAGVFLIMSFNLFLSYFSYFLLLISLMTLFQSGLMSILEMDMKKVVAFSTLNQIAFMILVYSNGYFFLSYSHLMIHAIFKSLLFLSVGVFIHLSFSSQTGFSYFPLLMIICTMFSIISLLAIAFTSGFYSKDYIVESVSSSYFSILMKFIIFLSILFTYMYSFRIMKSVLNFKMSKMNIMQFSLYFLFSIINLSFFSIFFSRFYFSYFLQIEMFLFKFFLLMIPIFMFYIWMMFFFKYYFLSLESLTHSFMMFKEWMWNSFIMFEYLIESYNFIPITNYIYLSGVSLKLKFVISFMFLLMFIFFIF